MSNSSIWPIDKTQSDATTPSQSGPGSNSIEGILHIPLTSKTGGFAIRLFDVKTRTFFAGVSTLGRDAVGVFNSPGWLGHSLGESYPLAEMQSVYSTAPADWATGWGSLTPLQRCSRCIQQPRLIGPLAGGVLPPCRDAVGVFNSPGWLGHSPGESYPPAEMQSVYSTAPADWATRLGSLTPLQRCSRCIQQPRLIGPLAGGVLPPCRDAVGIFYCPSWLGLKIYNRWKRRKKSVVSFSGSICLTSLPTTIRR